MESGATIEMILFEEFNCGDGSGSFVIEVDNASQPSALNFEGSNDVGTWAIDGGTGSYESLSGTGTLVANFGTGELRYTGEIQE